MSDWFVTLYKIEWRLILCLLNVLQIFFPILFSLSLVRSNLYQSWNLHIIKYVSLFPGPLWIYFLPILLQVFNPLGTYFCVWWVGDKDLVFFHMAFQLSNTIYQIFHTFPDDLKCLHYHILNSYLHTYFFPLDSLLCSIGLFICSRSDITLF